jgi:hypothetical protein
MPPLAAAQAGAIHPGYPGQYHGFIWPSFQKERTERWIIWYKAHHE